ncbi:MAG: DUF6529 family protein [Streptosporangiaceae bacterium]
MTAQSDVSSPAPDRYSLGIGKLVVPSLIGGLVALTLGVYGRLHHPTGVVVNIAGFTSAGYVKSWLATIATFFAIVQVTSALMMYGKIPRVRAPSWIGRLHQWSGRIAFLAAVPVAIDCLYGLGFQTYSTRVLIHSILGCAFFGFFTIKMLILPKRGLPNWTLPLAGALVFTVLVGLWFTSAFWFFSNFGVHR